MLGFSKTRPRLGFEEKGRRISSRPHLVRASQRFHEGKKLRRACQGWWETGHETPGRVSLCGWVCRYGNRAANTCRGLTAHPAQGRPPFTLHTPVGTALPSESHFPAERAEARAKPLAHSHTYTNYWEILPRSKLDVALAHGKLSGYRQKQNKPPGTCSRRLE